MHDILGKFQDMPRLRSSGMDIMGRLAIGVSTVVLGLPLVFADEAAPGDTAGQRWAVILVGLPGDHEHGLQFRKTAAVWENWLTKNLEFPAAHVIRLPAGPAEDDTAPEKLTADAIRTTFADLKDKLRPEDSLWVFTLGHGNYDGKRAWFHVAGRDPSDEDFGRWLGGIKCREQVIWLTHSCSGWFLKPLSRPGRIVITATAADDESNETEFPEALASAIEQPFEMLDADSDGKLSMAELFEAVVREVRDRFEADQRVPTEHAQLDDDGDGRGSEELAAKSDDDDNRSAATVAPAIPLNGKPDGQLSRKTFVGFKVRSAITPKSDDEPSDGR